MKFNINSLYKDVFTTDARYIDVWGGRARGGSHFGTDYLLYLMVTQPYVRAFFVRNKLSDIRDSLFRDFLDRLNDNDSINKNLFHILEKDMKITYLPNGNSIASKGITADGSRTAKMKSLAGATHILIEESDEIPEHLFDAMDLSLRTTKVDKLQIIRIFNPPKRTHWIWRDYDLYPIEYTNKFTGEKLTCYKGIAKEGRGVLSIWSDYTYNMHNVHKSTISKFAQFEETDIDYFLNQVKGYIITTDKGQIYTKWKPMSYDEWLAIDSPIVYGLDYGYSTAIGADPTAMIAMKYQGNKRYCHEMLYEVGIGTDELITKMDLIGVKQDSLIIGDAGAGGSLRNTELRRGFTKYMDDGTVVSRAYGNVYDAKKGQGSIKAGIIKVRDCENYYTTCSTNLIEELEKYKWVILPDKTVSDTPIDAHNHLLDGRRYLELMKGTIF